MISLDGIKISDSGDIIDIRQDKSLKNICEFHLNINIKSIKYLDSFPFKNNTFLSIIFL